MARTVETAEQKSGRILQQVHNYVKSQIDGLRILDKLSVGAVALEQAETELMELQKKWDPTFLATAKDKLETVEDEVSFVKRKIREIQQGVNALQNQ